MSKKEIFMKKNANIKTASIALVLCLFVLSACVAKTPQPVPATATPQPAKIANPASVNCEAKGGKLDIRTATDGSQSGVCTFPDGSECEEWAFLRGECAPRSKMPSIDPVTVPAVVDPTQALKDETQNKAVEIVRNKLAGQLKVEAPALKLVSVESIDWPDACLGIPQEGDTCAKEITPGFRITFSYAGQNYTYHTNLSASMIRQETV
jgi:putative hemolysin